MTKKKKNTITFGGISMAVQDELFATALQPSKFKKSSKKKRTKSLFSINI